VTKGSPHGNWSYDPNTNHLVGNGYGYDANGNALDVGSYDVENRTVNVPKAYNPDTQSQTEFYPYGADNKRVWKRRADGTEELYFYGITGQHLGTYNPALVYANGYLAAAINTSLYFGSRAIISKGVYTTAIPGRVWWFMSTIRNTSLGPLKKGWAVAIFIFLTPPLQPKCVP